MKAILSTLSKDSTVNAGLIMLAISFIVFLSTANIYEIDFDFFSGVFFFHFALTVIYLIMVMIKNKSETGRLFKFSSFARNMLLFQLFNISAYSLNRSVPVFNISVDWLLGFLMLSNGLLLLYALRKDFSVNWLNHLTVFIANVAILFHFYESLYVAPGYIIGFMGFWFFGISLHIFVPILFLIVFIKVARTFLKKSSKYWATTLSAWAVAFVLITYVSLRFNAINDIIDQRFHQTQKAYQDNDLPGWVTTSQLLQKDWITERALKCGLVYTSADQIFNSFGDIRLNERVKHDPLVLIASLFSGNINIATEDKVKILRYMYDARHQTERKLWSGDNLSTTDIVTNVQLFPEYCLAYTEKIFKIKNSRVDRWRNQQEALYTFYLPEGSVVTSAALWVKGKEEPAYLTTKGKADSAYQAIVGFERRDPLLLHWQEGNRVTVRVFPCTPDEDRQFKIGVTTPLRKKDGRLLYENVDFEGPYWKTAQESINVVTEGPLKNISAPFSFKESGTTYSYTGRYKSDWTLEFDALPLSKKAFTFNGRSFRLQDYVEQPEVINAPEIYLDINAAWTKKELKTIWKAVKNKKVFVYSNNRLEQVKETNRKALFKDLRRQNFGLFPFYKITNPEQTLVISKFNQLTPTLSDLEGSGFLRKTSDFFKEREIPVRLFNLGNEISPYLKTLQEIRAIQLVNEPIDALITALKNNTFDKNQEGDRIILNNYGDFQIVEFTDDGSSTSIAPDHLMRLFVYNDILKAAGKNYFHKKALEAELIDAAKEAYVVTPVSSLIVLETQADYDRFDIKKSKDSLQNASIGNSGAVPEPHEWLLICLIFGLTLYFYVRQKFLNQ